MNNDYLMHHGVKGQKWGIRRYQNEDGSLTEAGRKRYGIEGSNNKLNESGQKLLAKDTEESINQALKNYRKAYLNKYSVFGNGEYNEKYLKKLKEKANTYNKEGKTKKAEKYEKRINAREKVVSDFDHEINKYKSEVDSLIKTLSNSNNLVYDTKIGATDKPLSGLTMYGNDVRVRGADTKEGSKLRTSKTFNDFVDYGSQIFEQYVFVY